LLDRNRLNATLKAMGAKLKNLSPSSELSLPAEDQPITSFSLPPSLKSWTILLREAAPWCVACILALFSVF
jgi:hypothetical protein